ncbi:SET and MYND domain-containing protein DDB_G0273589-like [Wyeomyia smithii]|uniref:SET and MYND domain-containing protein DDB_G0273589-like n=1 Tax=Wyeomyia smithii TaxID=174621 RepID=UPI002467AFFA|nr:SET and MYND domain-containing protein DDB_G0273589-like [Wyeomyia smithii]
MEILQSLFSNISAGPSDYQKHMHRVYQKPMSAYTTKFFADAVHLGTADVTAYRDYVMAKGPFINTPDLPKSNEKAANVRQLGNELYQNRDYEGAIEKYNESICWAENGSEELGFGYANRSAVYYEQKEYHYALANIAMAKANNYPARSMPKLLARETNCRKNIKNPEAPRSVPEVRITLNVEVNPKIPHLAKGIRMKEVSGYGRSLVTERSFKAGDVILHEQPTMAAISPELKFMNCHYCSGANFQSLIPCPDCASVMYCNEQCMQKGREAGHRYECGITEKLQHISYGSNRIYLGPRMFFYGLSLYNHSLDEMMTYASEAGNSASTNPLLLDYTKLNPLEAFKVFHHFKLPTEKFMYEESFRFYAAVYYSVYMKHPLVKSIVINQSKKDFMLRYILHYMRMIGFLTIGAYENFTNQVHLIASVCNHSCDPNTWAVYNNGQLKFIVILPIAKGDQILISYGPLYGTHSDFERQQMVAGMHFECKCIVCDRSNNGQLKAWLASTRKLQPIPRKSGSVLMRVLDNDDCHSASKLNAVQQFVRRYAAHHPGEAFDKALTLYQQMLTVTHMMEVRALLRANLRVV